MKIHTKSKPYSLRPSLYAFLAFLLSVSLLFSACSADKEEANDMMGGPHYLTGGTTSDGTSGADENGTIVENPFIQTSEQPISTFSEPRK